MRKKRKHTRKRTKPIKYHGTGIVTAVDKCTLLFNDAQKRGASEASLTSVASWVESTMPAFFRKKGKRELPDRILVQVVVDEIAFFKALKKEIRKQCGTDFSDAIVIGEAKELLEELEAIA